MEDSSHVIHVHVTLNKFCGQMRQAPKKSWHYWERSPPLARMKYRILPKADVGLWKDTPSIQTGFPIPIQNIGRSKPRHIPFSSNWTPWSLQAIENSSTRYFDGYFLFQETGYDWLRNGRGAMRIFIQAADSLIIWNEKVGNERRIGLWRGGCIVSPWKIP